MFKNQGFLLASCLVLVAAFYFGSFLYLIDKWTTSDEYSHGLLIPFLIVYIVWSERGLIFDHKWVPAPSGLTLVIFGLVLNIAAVAADIESVKVYSMIVVTFGVLLVFSGTAITKRLLFPILLFLFAVPLPNLFNVLLTSKMQFISSSLGVWMLRVMGFAVYQDGNVIDMHNFKLLVAEACSGLRYLYPLMSIGLLLSYFYKGPRWIRFSIFIATVPVTIVMNSLRIAITGILIKNWGNEAAEGFLHDFEGWVVFIAALLLLLLIAGLLNIFTTGEQSFMDRFRQPASSSPACFFHYDKLPRISLATFAFITVLGSVGALISLTKQETIPARTTFENFPLFIDNRHLIRSTLSTEVLDVLKADDHFIGDYRAAGSESINLYIAYYGKQHGDKAIHSPKQCLPGGGWVVSSLTQVNLDMVDGDVNRAIIEKDNAKLLVYYWIYQQGNSYANEFVARASLLYQSVLYGRTDGALIRVIVPVNTEMSIAEREAHSFMRALKPILPNYLPGKGSPRS